MAEIKWIKLSTQMFDNRKIRQIECLPDGDAIVVIWVKLLCLAGSINDSGMVYFTKEIPYTEQMLATQFNRPLATVQMAMKIFEQFKMVEIINDIMHISNWEKYQNIEGMDKIREQNRLRQARFKSKQKAISADNVTDNVTITDSNATEEDKDKDKDIDIEIKKEKIPYQQIADLYNSLCPSLPSIKSLSENRKKAIRARLNSYSISDFETLFRKTEASDFLKGSNDRNWTATFDWLIKDANMAKVLDGNYDNRRSQPVSNGRKEVVPAWMNKPSFNDMESRDFDFDQIEKASMQQLHGQKTVGNDQDLKARADALRKKLG